MASTYLSRTNGTPDSQRTFTFSFWVKRSKLGTFQYIQAFQDSGVGDPRINLAFRDSDLFELTETQAGVGAIARLRPSRVFRDTSAWYHIVVAVDTTNATADDRIKIWVNGEQETSMDSRTNYSLNYNSVVNDNSNTIGAFYNPSIGGYFDGSIAHFHYIDGTAYEASAFGETDSTTGIWKPKTAPSVTYGTNGFFLKFENSGAFGTDSSGNSNTFTVNGTMTQTIDTPSNVFATWNPLNNYYQGSAFSNGNTTLTYANSGFGPNVGNTTTLGVSKGKYYFEIKYGGSAGGGGTVNDTFIGITPRIPSNADHEIGHFSDEWGYKGQNGNLRNNDSETASWGGTWSTNDIIQIGLDLDNNKLYFGVNGTWQNSADPSAGTGGISITDPASTETGHYFVALGAASNELKPIGYLNCGNGIFGTTAVSSAQNPDDGIGIFEYDVPAGYRALCTKSINATEYS